MPLRLHPTHTPLTTFRRRLLSLGAVAVLLVGGGSSLAQNEPAQPRPARLDVSYVPTPENVVQRMLELVEAGPDDYVVDLGSGDGRIVIAAARDFGVQRALGVDIDPQRVAEAQHNAAGAGVDDRVGFEEGDIFELDFSDATVVTMYLLPNLNVRLRPTILEMAPGTRIVSHAFDMGDWEPDVHEQVNRRDIYLWIVPAQVGGDWEVELADGSRFEIMLTQKFQRITGRATLPERHVPLSSIRLEGADIRFSIDEQRFVGRVEGDTLVAVETEGALSGWRATRR